RRARRGSPDVSLRRPARFRPAPSRPTPAARPLRRPRSGWRDPTEAGGSCPRYILLEQPLLGLRGERGLCGRRPRDGGPEWRRADVIEAHLLEEPDRVRIAAVLAADAQLEILLDAAALVYGDLDQLADAARVDRRERVLLHDLELLIMRQERPGVVARHA